MLTNAQWLPISNSLEKELLDKLISRSHVRGLRYNMIKDRPLAVSVLSDCEKPTALYINPTDASDVYKKTLTELIDSSNLESWVWDASQVMPTLPPVVDAIEKREGDD